MHERLKLAREAADYESASAAARAFGWKIHTYKHHESGQRGFPRSKAMQYARAFRVSAGWLLTGEGAAPARGGAARGMAGQHKIETVTVVGAVQAGVWREALEWPEGDRYAISTLASTRFPGLPRFALEVRGDSMNRTVRNGWIIFCVRPTALLTPKAGDLVVVETRAGTGDMEATLKRLDLRDGVWWLLPESDNPEYSPIRLGPDMTANGDRPLPGHALAGHIDDDGAFEITAIVDQFLGAP